MRRKLLALSAMLAFLACSGCSQIESYAPVTPNYPATTASEPLIVEEAVSASAVISEGVISETRELTAAEVSFVLKTNMVNTATDWIDYEIANKTDKEFVYGEDFTLLRDEDGALEYVDMLPDTGFSDLQIILMPNTANNGSIDIGKFFGALDAGSYRLEKDVFAEDEAYVAVTTFEVAFVK